MFGRKRQFLPLGSAFWPPALQILDRFRLEAGLPDWDLHALNQS